MLSFLLYTSLFAAFCAVSLCVGTECLILGRMPPLFIPLHAFIFGCTLMVYNLHFLIRKSTARLSDRYRWSHEHKIWHYVVFGLGVLLSLSCLYFLSWEILTACVVLGLLSFAYTLPLLPLPRKARLRDFGYAKIFILTMVWTIVTSVLPMLYWKHALADYPVEIAIRFVFMFTLCVAFDIRDMQTDINSGIHTIPNVIGIRNSYRLMYISLVLFVLLCLMQYLRYPVGGRIVGELLAALATLWAIRYTKRHSSDKNYLGVVDGMMLLYGCLIAVLS